MGMKLQGSWTCELCDRVENVELGLAPEGWYYLIIAEPVVDATDHSVDVSLADLYNNRKLACTVCMRAYSKLIPPKAEPVPDIEEPTPVEPLVEPLVLSDEEKVEEELSHDD